MSFSHQMAEADLKSRKRSLWNVRNYGTVCCLVANVLLIYYLEFATVRFASIYSESIFQGEVASSACFTGIHILNLSSYWEQ